MIWPSEPEAIITLTLITSLVFGPRWDGTRGFLSNEAQRPKKKKVIGKGGGNGGWRLVGVQLATNFGLIFGLKGNQWLVDLSNFYVRGMLRGEVGEWKFWVVVSILTPQNLGK